MKILQLMEPVDEKTKCIFVMDSGHVVLSALSFLKRLRTECLKIQ